MIKYSTTDRNGPMLRKSQMLFHHRGFTLIEMLVAMAITLLMIGAVAKAFAFVGERVRDSRAAMEMSSDLRDISTRLNDELRRCTVTLQPNQGGTDQAGYFLYHEGPCTNATSTILGATSTVDGSIVASNSRYGDMDDYLAFTAVATPGSWYFGQVPQFVLSGVATDTTPVVIRSRYAEIVYFTNPERDTTGAVIDTNGDNLPDRLLLYRRVLLIRPDLNLNGGTSMHSLSAGANWQTGMTGVHQICDVSVRRALDSDGLPSSAVVANSLEDLSVPHNRFAHVRVPSAVLSVGGTPAGTTMPILALESPPLIISNASTASPALRPVNNSTNTGSVVMESRWSGYLQRSFLLAGVRRGEDVIANNCRSLDIQIFDPSARFFMTSNNLILGPSDAGYREAFFDAGAADVGGGGFVDLAYPVLAGGPMRGWNAIQVAAQQSAANSGNAAIPVGTGNANLLGVQTPFSGLEFSPTATTFPTVAAAKTYSESLLRSGRVLLAGNQVVFFQPAFDTYTSAYETDGFYQDRRFLDASNLFLGSYWRQLTGSPIASIDLGADGLDYTTTATPILPIRSGVDGEDERETSAPFSTKPEAIRISVRLENLGSRQLKQSSVVFRGR